MRNRADPDRPPESGGDETSPAPVAGSSESASADLADAATSAAADFSPADYYDLPSDRQMHGRTIEWDLRPEWVTSVLAAPTHSLGSPLDVGGAASGEPFDATGLGHVAGGIGGFISLITASGPEDKVSGGLSVLENATGLGSVLAETGSRAPVSVLAARLGAASVLLNVASAWWEAFTGGGAAIQAGVEQREREGERDGFLRGYGASLIGMSQQSIETKLALAPGTSESLPSQVRAYEAYKDAYYTGIRKGYEAAQQLPTETALAIVSEADRFATERHIYLSPNRDYEVALVDALKRVLPLLTSEVREGTWEASSEQLRAADQEPLVSESEEEERVLDAGDDLWVIAADSLAEAWGRPPTEAETLSYWEAIVETNEGEQPGASSPGDFQPGSTITLPQAPPDPFPASRPDDAGGAAANPGTQAEQDPSAAGTASDGLYDMEAEANAHQADVSKQGEDRTYDMSQDITTAGAPTGSSGASPAPGDTAGAAPSTQSGSAATEVKSDHDVQTGDLSRARADQDADSDQPANDVSGQRVDQADSDYGSTDLSEQRADDYSAGEAAADQQVESQSAADARAPAEGGDGGA